MNEESKHMDSRSRDVGSVIKVVSEMSPLNHRDHQGLHQSRTFSSPKSSWCTCGMSQIN